MVFELSSVARLTPEGPGGEAPVYELGKAMDWGPDTLFPQLSRFPCNSTWWGSSHGATWCHIPRDIQQCHRVAYGCHTLRQRLAMAMAFGRSYSSHAWRDHENHWKTITTLTVLGYAWKWGPRASALASTRSSKFGSKANHQIPCSRNLPATPPQQNLVSGMLLVCSRI